jgi:hypothetical protein
MTAPKLEPARCARWRARQQLSSNDFTTAEQHAADQLMEVRFLFGLQYFGEREIEFGRAFTSLTQQHTCIRCDGTHSRERIGLHQYSGRGLQHRVAALDLFFCTRSRSEFRHDGREKRCSYVFRPGDIAHQAGERVVHTAYL